MRCLPLFFVALLSAAPAAAKPAPDKAEAAQLRWARLPMARSDLRPPRGYPAAKKRWKRATHAFHQKKYKTAAKHFDAIARSLKAPRRSPHARTLQTARCLSYENAAWSTYLGRGKTQARKYLARLRKRERGCRYNLQRLAGLLP